MITEKQIEIAKALINTGLVNSVYHSVELVEDDKGSGKAMFPAYKIGNEQFYIGPDDSKKMFAYIRLAGSSQTSKSDFIGGCTKIYSMQAPCRIVVFQDHLKDNFDTIIRKLLLVGFVKDVSLLGFTNNAFHLAKQESPLGKFAFDATTFYLAIDVQIKFLLTPDSCVQDYCSVHPNPIV